MPLVGGRVRRLARRSFSLGLAVLALLVVPELTLGAYAGEAILMPFSCALRNGKPALNSAAPTRHAIIGERKKRDYRACKDAAGRDCRSMVLYSFAVSCQGKSVPWYQLAAQIRSNDVGLSWIESGELNLVLKKSQTATVDRKMARYVMPTGYAPIEELGARVVAGVPQVVAATDEARPGSLGAEGGALQAAGPVENGSSRVIVPTIDNAVVVRPAEAGSGAGKEATDDQWKAVVQHGEPGEQDAGSFVSEDGRGTIGFAEDQGLAIVMFLFAATGLIAALGWYGRRHVMPGPAGKELVPAMPEVSGGSFDTSNCEPELAERGQLAARVAGAAGGVSAMLHSRWVGFKWRRLKAAKPWEWSNASIANGARSAEALFENAERAVLALGAASSLRDTLSAELKSVRQKLDGLRSGTGEKPKTARVAASLRAVVRDLERIGRIAESAAVSVKGGGEKILMPKTRAEAFEVLGVNASVTEGALKRIVDALRMGWHPDHAKDEVDKRLREERTKQINIAWDLIAGKRIA